MIALLFISVAAVAKAMADTLDHHFDTSIFRNKPRKYFDPNVIHKTAPQILGYPLDAWHIANSVMIVSFLVAIVTAKPIEFTIFKIHIYAWGGFAVLVYGLLFNGVFNLFYNKIFK